MIFQLHFQMNTPLTESVRWTPKIFLNKNSQLSQQTKPLAMYHTNIFEACKNTHELKVQFILKATRVWQRMPDLNTNWQSLAVFVLCFKIHALWLSNSRAAVLKTAFFVHRTCCQLFQSTFPNFFSVKLGIYCCRQADVNNFVSKTWGVSAIQSVEIDHRQSPQFTVAFTNYLSRKRWIQLFATMGDELFCHDGRWAVCHTVARRDKSESGRNKAP